MSKSFKKAVLLLVVASLMVFTVACGGGTATPAAPSPEKPQAEAPKAEAPKLSGNVLIDGSSTVYPIQEAIAEEYRSVQPNVRVTVGVSGTGGGFKKFTAGETDMSNASRHIKGEEKEAAEKNGIEYVELPLAYDGLSVVVSKQNDFVKDLSVNELQKIWTGEATKWNQVRKEFPDAEIKLFGPGTDSGTFDYFVEAIIGKDKKITPNFVASEDDNIIVRGVSADKFGIAYFGYAYYEENHDKLNLVAISPKDGEAAILPTEKTINDGTYAPLSRPIFVYVNKKSFKENPQIQDFAYFMNEKAGELALQVGYINMPAQMYEDNKKLLDSLK
ncbi:phosphate-binding protein [Desulfuribacillus stibiiarsenatis]|uniref:Phosphate-binding protein n=1 Tax=Desulfuribacillus stibiiarsenatis TaxID=1390249 RepID=A0A1E5L2Z7_9FIRM|nr:PstS family phosphate ABC transporter substrate-binding protein [Desulfuribacillus stibiiarsenatis]OEH84456.1 phosphate-binding protein [Desulfuribacillus stibiiarsenatis]